MAITRTLANGNLLTDWTEEVNEIDNQYGLLNGMGLFNSKGTSQRSIVFDKDTVKTVLLPRVNPTDRHPVMGRDRKLETYSLAIPYFKAFDAITVEDIQGKRMGGTPDSPETLANVVAEKLEDLRMSADQTKEYMKIQAIKGITKAPSGETLADMFNIFGLTRSNYQTDFVLGTSSTNVDLKISEVKRAIAKNAKTGGAIGKIMVLCDPEFFDKLTTHATIRDAYKYYINSGKQLLRDDLSAYEKWGVVDMFEHKGVLFMSYDAEFVLPDNTTEAAFAASEGFSIVSGARSVYRGYHGPATKLSMANTVGQEMYVWQTTDDRDEKMDLELQMAGLYFMTKPQLSWRVYSSN